MEDLKEAIESAKDLSATLRRAADVIDESVETCELIIARVAIEQ